MKFSNKQYIILFVIALIIIILLICYLYKNIERKSLLESFTDSPPTKIIDITGRKKELIQSIPIIFKNTGLVKT